ncbi:MAG: hypothetical protein GY906_32740 [bacterium]|nr:hypothetical protein [bacterium]
MARTEQTRGVRSFPGGVALPNGVALAEWYLEKARWQNPRIRGLMGCLNLMDDVLESNFAILHSSPIRIREIWRTVREVAQTLQTEVAPLLERSSKLPQLAEAVEQAQQHLAFLETELLDELARFPTEPVDDQFDSLRKVLCVATGKLHAFLLDSLAAILAADPRSQGDSDYFLSRKFARDVEEAEWLYSYVARLGEYLEGVDKRRHDILESLAKRLDAGGALPSMDEWGEISSLLNEMAEGLTSTLRSVLGLRGIRIDELQVLESHSNEIPDHCRVLEELYATARVTVAQLHGRLPAGTSNAPITVAREVLGERIALRVHQLVNNLRDLSAFVPLWLQGLSNRRALMLQRRGENPEDVVDDADQRLDDET